jgi:hypothetical protein
MIPTAAFQREAHHGFIDIGASIVIPFNASLEVENGSMQIRHAVLDLAQLSANSERQKLDHCAAGKGEAIILDTPINSCRHWHLRAFTAVLRGLHYGLIYLVCY